MKVVLLHMLYGVCVCVSVCYSAKEERAWPIDIELKSIINQSIVANGCTSTACTQPLMESLLKQTDIITKINALG